MTSEERLQKYNVPVPRYTSYPPANYFHGSFGPGEYEAALEESNTAGPAHISFYIHIPFCRHLCHYCGCNSFVMTAKKTVDRYISALHTEIDKVAGKLNNRRKIAQIHYGGGTPTLLPVSTLRELNRHLLAGFECIDQPEIAIECHPGYMDESYWTELTEAGFNRFSLGIQDFNDQVLKAVNRRPSLLPVETIVTSVRKKGMRINMDFIYGLPFQTAESFAATIRRAAELQPDRLVTFSYAHVPWVNKRQLIIEKTGLPPGGEKGRMYENARSILTDAGYQTIGMDHFVKETDELYPALLTGQLHRNFQGYCTRRTTGQVYALGVTGISQLYNGYAQNSKDIVEYINRIENDSFATVKGYRLKREEQITGMVIESLMCNYTINWKELEEQLMIPSEQIKEITGYNFCVLKTFAEDGIITMDNDHIRITPEGSLFIRNVAASLDKKMQQTTRSFSKPV